MALPPNVSRVTRAAQEQLQRVQGDASSAIDSVSSAARNAVDQAKSSFDIGGNLSVLTRATDSITGQFSAATGSFQEVLSNLGAAGAAAASAAGAADAINFEQAISQLTRASTSSAVIGRTENQLKAYASYNYNITLACLTVNELNFPDQTYRSSPPQVTVLKSGGGLDLTKAKTAYERADAQLEYFIDDLEIGAIIAPSPSTRTSNATMGSFTVHEPYSMGLFLQTLMVAAINAGHADYLKAPYALIIEFRGYDDNGNILDTDAVTRRVFPIKINKVDFDVTGSGSAYRIGIHAWNETALSATAQTVTTDTIINGNTIQELLQSGPESLTGIINRRIREKASKENTINKDEYVIMFPQELVSSLGLSNQAGTTGEQRAAMTREEFFMSISGIIPDSAFPEELDAAEAAYQNYINLQASDNNISASVRRIADDKGIANAIGKATIAQSMAEGGAVPFGRAALTYDQENGIYRNDRIQISNNFRTLQFPSGTSIEQIIEEVVKLSSYARLAAARLQANSNGMLPWFRIHTQTFLVPDADVRARTGENPKIFVYAVVPYEVHSSTFSNATQPSVGIEQRISQAAKTYNYVYTGKNDDIIDFEISFNNAFFKALSSNINGSAGARMAAREASNDPNNANYQPADGQAGNNSLAGSTRVAETNASAQGQAAGSDIDSPEIQIARNFNEAIVNSNVDLVTMDLTVLGDPYYLADTGQGNYNSPRIAQAYTRDGTMDYQRSEVEVVVNFRTPIDYNTNTGGIIFPENTVPVKAFSGLYKVNQVRNNFSGGKFTQVLQLLRRPNQTGDIGSRGTPGEVRVVEPATTGDATTGTNTSSSIAT